MVFFLPYSFMVCEIIFRYPAWKSSVQMAWSLPFISGKVRLSSIICSCGIPLIRLQIQPDIDFDVAPKNQPYAKY